MRTFIIILSVIIIIYLIFTYIMFFIVSRRVKKNFTPMEKAVRKTLKPFKDLINTGNKWIKEKEKNKQIKDVFLKSKEDLKLHAMFIENKENKGIFIEIPGYRSTPMRDLYPSCYEYYDMGYSLLLIDNRSSGSSEGKYITFGMRESEDLIRWIKYINKKYPDLNIILGGVSMGASTIMMSMNRIKDDMNVKKIIVDCGYISAYEEVKYCIKHYFHIPSFPFIKMVNIWCKLIAKFDLEEKNTIRSMRKSNIPVLFIHGEEDDFVPTYNSKVNYKNYNGPKKLLLFKKASHGISYLVEPNKYIEAVKDFVNKGE